MILHQGMQVVVEVFVNKIWQSTRQPPTTDDPVRCRLMSYLLLQVPPSLRANTIGCSAIFASCIPMLCKYSGAER